jgi:hypothetical protein
MPNGEASFSKGEGIPSPFIFLTFQNLFDMFLNSFRNDDRMKEGVYHEI